MLASTVRAVLAQRIAWALLVVVGLARAASAEVVAHVDLRGGTEAVGAPSHHARRYFVVICARKSERLGTGHSFVVWIEQDGSGRTTHSHSWGFYPTEDRVLLHLTGGVGNVSDEATRRPSTQTELLTHRLVIEVDGPTYLRSQGISHRWRKQPRHYNLLARNCTHFAHDVAQSTGLDAPHPRFAEPPHHYLTRLIELNTHEDADAGDVGSANHELATSPP